MMTHCCILILAIIITIVVGIIVDYVFVKTLLYIKKRAIKIGTPKSWPSNHSNSAIHIASNQNLQKLLKSEL